MALSADILRGYTDTIILRQLSQGDSYGYQINKNVTALSGGAVEMKEATLYTAFRRLESAGYIRSYWGDEMSGARRRYYALTDAGLDKLTAKQFCRMVHAFGSERILFGTDSPWSDQAQSKNDILALPLTEHERNNIFYKNAKRLSKL